MNLTYRRALSYAWKCCPPLSKDLTHTAFIRHFDRHGTNLFERDIYVVLRWVKNVWFNELRSSRYQKDGELYNRQFFTPSEDWSDDPNCITLQSPTGLPDSEIITKEFYQELFNRIDNYTNGRALGCKIDTNILRQIVELLDGGYTYPEICEELGMSAQRVHYYKKKIKGIIQDMEMKSPLNGDNTRVKMKITRKVYDMHPEKYGEYVYDPDKGCDSNEYFCTVTNGVDFILIREHGKD